MSSAWFFIRTLSAVLSVTPSIVRNPEGGHEPKGTVVATRTAVFHVLAEPGSPPTLSRTYCLFAASLGFTGSFKFDKVPAERTACPSVIESTCAILEKILSKLELGGIVGARAFGAYLLLILYNVSRIFLFYNSLSIFFYFR